MSAEHNITVISSNESNVVFVNNGVIVIQTPPMYTQVRPSGGLKLAILVWCTESVAAFVTRLHFWRSGNWGSVPVRGRAFEPAVGPNQRSSQWILFGGGGGGVYFDGVVRNYRRSKAVGV